MDKIALIPDLHCGDEDRRAIELACKVVEVFNPTTLIYLGDILDSGWASSFPQDKRTIRGVVKREKDAWQSVARMFKSAAPNAVVKAIPGNHDWRIIRGFAWAHPEFDGDESTDLSSILKCAELGIQWIERPAAIFLASKNFVATHGVVVRKHSGSSAMGEMAEKWWMSGASAHTHRMGQVFRTVQRGIYCWTECGHLMSRNPKYRNVNEVAPENWQQGIVLMYADQHEFRLPSMIPFWPRRRRLRTRWEEKEFEA